MFPFTDDTEPQGQVWLAQGHVGISGKEVNGLQPSRPTSDLLRNQLPPTDLL